MIATDQLEGDALRHFAFEEITQCLGIPRDSHRFRDSIFFAGDFKKGDPVAITDRDARLIEFLYTRLQPGYSYTRVSEAAAAFWRDPS